MALLITLLLVTASVFVGWRVLAIRGLQPAEYPIRTAEELEPYVRSWGQWLEQGRIMVRNPTNEATVEFRKFRYKTRPDALVYRYRNADATRHSFNAVRDRLGAQRVVYELERTQKRQQPRALAIRFDSDDVFTPAAAARLLHLTFGDPLPELLVSCVGRFRLSPDAPTVKIIPSTRAGRSGFSLGLVLGRLRWRGGAV